MIDPVSITAGALVGKLLDGASGLVAKRARVVLGRNSPVRTALVQVVGEAVESAAEAVYAGDPEQAEHARALLLERSEDEWPLIDGTAPVDLGSAVIAWVRETRTTADTEEHDASGQPVDTTAGDAITNLRDDPLVKRLCEDILDGIQTEATRGEGTLHPLWNDFLLNALPERFGKSSTRTPMVPAQLPPTIAGFVGRRNHLQKLDTLLAAVDGEGERAGTVVISAVAGTAGVGKTTLAVHWARQRRVRERFPDGQLYVNLRGFDPSWRPTEPADAIRGFLDAFEVPPERIPVDLDKQAALYRSMLADKRVLVVLDNARDTNQVRPLLPGSPGCLVLVTSRNSLESLAVREEATRLDLDVLTPDEARGLLARRFGADRVDTEPEAVREIVEACARLPLALAIVAARVAGDTIQLTALASHLRDARSRLDAFAGSDIDLDLRAVLSWSYEQLAPAEQRVFRLLGLHPGPDTSAAATASHAALPPHKAATILRRLKDAHLLTEHVHGRYTFHDLLREYAAELTEQLDDEAERRAATHRMFDHYLHTAHTAYRVLNPLRDPILLPLAPAGVGVTPERIENYDQAMRWFTTEHAVLLALLHRAAATGGVDTQVWQLALSLDTFLERRGHWHDLAAAWRTGLDAAERLGDPAAQAFAHRLLGDTCTRLGQLGNAKSHLTRALDLDTRLGDPAGQARSRRTLGVLCARQGRWADAIDHAQHALTHFQAAGHRRGQAATLNAIGWYQAHLGDHHQALDSCRQALTLSQDLEDRIGEAAAWDSLGYAHHQLAQYTDAIDRYQHALALCRELGYRYDEADTLTHLGDTQHAAGQPETARKNWQQALTILNDLDHPDAETVRTKLAALDLDPAGSNDAGGSALDA